MCKFAKSHELGIVGLAELTVEKEECYKVCMSMVWFGLVQFGMLDPTNLIIDCRIN